MAANSGGQHLEPGPGGDAEQQEVQGGALAPAQASGYASAAAKPQVTKWLILHLERTDKSVNMKLSPTEKSRLLYSKSKLGLPEEQGKVLTLEDWEWEKIRIEVSGDVDIESYRPTVALEIRDGLRVLPSKEIRKRETWIKVCYTSVMTPNEEIVKSLSHFGDVLKGPNHLSIEVGEKEKNEYTEKLKYVRSGDRGVLMHIVRPIPSYIMVGGKKARVWYKGQNYSCPRCHQSFRFCPGKANKAECKKKGGPEIPLEKFWAELIRAAGGSRTNLRTGEDVYDTDTIEVTQLPQSFCHVETFIQYIEKVGGVVLAPDQVVLSQYPGTLRITKLSEGEMALIYDRMHGRKVEVVDEEGKKKKQTVMFFPIKKGTPIKPRAETNNGEGEEDSMDTSEPAALQAPGESKGEQEAPAPADGPAPQQGGPQGGPGEPAPPPGGPGGTAPSQGGTGGPAPPRGGPAAEAGGPTTPSAAGGAGKAGDRGKQKTEAERRDEIVKQGENMISGATGFLSKLGDTVSSFMTKASAPAKPHSKSPSQPDIVKPSAPVAKGEKVKPQNPNIVEETPEPTKPNQYDATNSPVLAASPGEKDKDVKTKLFQSPEININEVFDSSTKISEERLDEDMNNSAGKYTSAFARRLSTDFRNELRRQSGTFERQAALPEAGDEKKKLPPGANFKKEIPRPRRISRTVSVSYREPRKEESLKRGHSPTPEKSEGEFTIPASTSKKLMKKQKQRERKEAEKAKEVEKAEKSVGEEVEQLKPGEEKDKEKEKKKLSPSNTKKSSATRASVRHKKF